MNQVLADRYQLQAELARGAAGVVHRARDLITGDDVAIKVLHADAASEPDVATAFLDEAEVLTELNHPGIVRPRDLIVNGTLMALVMDLVDGQDLRRLVIEGGPLPADRVAAIVAEIAEALAAVHDEGIVHGDVKPGNILIPADGTSAKLVDFGIARRITSPDVPTHATPDYTAPEIIDGSPSSDKSDVYGLGIVLYEALCGASPYRGGGVDEVLERHRTLMPERPSCVAEELWEIVEACLALNPFDRPAAREIPGRLLAISALLSAEAVPVQTPRLRPRTPVTPVEPITHMGPMPDVAHTPPVGGAPMPFVQEPSKPKERNKSKLVVAAAATVVALAAAGVLGFVWLSSPVAEAEVDDKQQAEEQTADDESTEDRDAETEEEKSPSTEKPSPTEEPTSAPTQEPTQDGGTGGDSGEEMDGGGSEGDFPGEGPIGSTFPDRPGGR